MRRAWMFALVAFTATTTSACVRTIAAPTAPFGHPIDAMRAPAAARAETRSGALAGRTIVVGPVDSEITQPIGGAYDRSDYEHSPLARAWFVPEIATVLGDALVAAVARSGGVGLRETSGVLLASARSLPMRREGAEQWRIRIVALEHDLVRDDEADEPYAEIAARVVVERVAGGPDVEAAVERAPSTGSAVSSFEIHLRLGIADDALAALADAIVARMVSR